MIDKEKFKSELKVLLDEKFPNGEYRKMHYLAVEGRVCEKMDRYIQETYATYYGDNLLQLYRERDFLLEQCLVELGVPKKKH